MHKKYAALLQGILLAFLCFAARNPSSARFHSVLPARPAHRIEPTQPARPAPPKLSAGRVKLARAANGGGYLALAAAPDAPGGDTSPGGPDAPPDGSPLPPVNPDVPPANAPDNPDTGNPANPDTGPSANPSDTTPSDTNPSDTTGETNPNATDNPDFSEENPEEGPDEALNPSGTKAKLRTGLRRFGDSYFDQARARIRAAQRRLQSAPATQNRTQGRNNRQGNQANTPTNNPSDSYPNAVGVIVGPEFSSPAPEHYSLGPGDTLTVRYWNDVTPVREVDLTVDARGTINLPVGGRPLVVRGQTVEGTENLVRRELSRLVRNPQVSVTLKRLRSISVTLMGNSFAPGTYQMPSSTTLFNALYLTGGPDQTGSMRGIQLKRPGGSTRTFDFYRFLINGDSSQDIPLQSGDLIFIPPARTQVSVQGEVLRPAIYELAPGETLDKAIHFAGGVKPSAVAQRVSVQSVRPGIARRLLDVNLLTATGGDLKLYDGDSVTVFAIRPQIENMITLTGAVDQPSHYQLTPGMTIADLIERARGTLSSAYTKRADLFRQQPDGSEQLVVIDLDAALKRDPKENVVLQPNDRIVIYGVNDVQWMGTHHLTLTGAVRKPGIFERAEGERVSDLLVQAGGLKPEAETRMAFLQRTNPDGSPGPLLKINLIQAAAEDPVQDVVLQDRDDLKVFTIEEANFRPEQKVEIKGAVQQPGTYFRSSNMTVVDLVQLAGGLLPDAYASQVYIQRKADDGTVGPLILTDLQTALAGDQAQNATLKDGDVVIINNKEQAQFTAKQTVQILGAVQRPGSYPRASNMTLLDLLRLAGGPLPNASDSVEVAKAIAPKTQKSVIYSLAQTMQGGDSNNPKIVDEDVVTVHTRGDVRTQVETVTLSGAVNQPGTYAIADGERLSSIIQRAGGLTKQAYPVGSQFFRDTQYLTTGAQRDLLPGVAQILSVVSEQEYKRALGRAELDRLKLVGGGSQTNAAAPNPVTSILPTVNPAAGAATQAVGSATPSAAPQTQVETVSAARPLLEEDWMPGGNLDVDVGAAVQRPGSRDDVAMRNGDILNIPNRPTTVSIVGAVLQPSSVLFTPGQPIGYYVERSGGFLQDAASDQVIIIHSNGQLLLPKGKKVNARVELGDVILVPTKVMADRLKDQGANIDRVANRISSTAIMLAVLKTLLK